MRPAAEAAGLGSTPRAWISLTAALSLFCGCCGIGGCSLDSIFPPSATVVSNEVALDRALRISSLTEGERPFHLVLEIFAPNSANPQMHAEIEVFWINPITYRTVIRSPSFSQVRIVNGRVVEEHDTGDFYPRWIQNFVDALLEPAPEAAILRRIPGTIPLGPAARGCISNSGQDADQSGSAADETSAAEVCLEGPDPKISSSLSFSRFVSFEDFAPFGSQLIPRTLIDDLPVNLLLHGHIVRLEPLARADYGLTKAHEFTLPAQQIQTSLVPIETAESLLESAARPARPVRTAGFQGEQTAGQMTLYIRTDRTGKVREAYRNSADHFHQQDAAVARALTLKFRPLLVHGVPQQMEAPIALP